MLRSFCSILLGLLLFSPLVQALEIATWSTSRSSDGFGNTTHYSIARNAISNALGDVTFTGLNTLTDQGLVNMDMLVIDTSSNNNSPLSSSEQSALSNFVTSGGTLFAHVHSSTEPYFSRANAILNIFGLQGVTGSIGGSVTSHPVSFVDNPIVNGPFGVVSNFTNQNESRFQALTSFADTGVLNLASAGSNLSFLAHLPRGVHGSGQAIFFTNYHSLLNPSSFGSAGSFTTNQSNQNLLLNIAADADNFSAVPEPNSLLLLGLGALLLLAKQTIWP